MDFTAKWKYTYGTFSNFAWLLLVGQQMFSWFCYQRPHKATQEEMTKFHSDDYIKFLRSIRPDNMSDFNKQMQRCEWLLNSTSLNVTFLQLRSTNFHLLQFSVPPCVHCSYLRPLVLRRARSLRKQLELFRLILFCQSVLRWWLVFYLH